MFTGIIEEKGSIRHVSINGDSGSIAIKAHTVIEDAHIGDSIAVNGVCLTVTSLQPDGFTADVMAETVRQTSLAGLAPGSEVNLERAMAAGGRFGGHIVSGHITGTGRVSSMREEGNATWITVDASADILRYVVERGSIAIDGMSLTVARVDDHSFSVSIIPHTASNTTILRHKIGDTLNLETDIIAKYVEKLMHPSVSTDSDDSTRSSLTMEDLLEMGF